jgi:hypothetical protein
VNGFPPHGGRFKILAGFKVAGISIADHPFFQGFSQASRARIKAAELVLDAAIRDGDAQEIEAAYELLFQIAAEELWKRLKPDAEAFMPRALELWSLVYGPNVKMSARVMQHLHVRVLLRSAAILEAESHAVPQSSPNKAATPRSRTKSAGELRRKVREMKRDGYTQERMCSTLDLDLKKWPIPPNVGWRSCTSWSDAFMHPSYGPSVKKWLSKHAGGA